VSRAFVLFGANIQPERHVVRAMALLRASFPVVAVSPVYRTAPAGDPDQEDFLNVAVELRTSAPPQMIHERLREIEALLGRRRDPTRPLGPRTADLDLVLVEGLVGTFGAVELPHPTLADQAFALVPLADLAPELPHPTLGVPLADLARRAVAGSPRPPVRVELGPNHSPRVALVTGGAVRLGRAIVEALAAAGHAVAFSYRSSARHAETLQASLAAAGVEALAVPADLAQPEARRHLVDAVLVHFGRLDVLVNNAAIFPRTPIETLSEEAFQEVMATNLAAPVFLAKAAAGVLRHGQGCIVNIADIYGLFPLRHHLAYSVSKAGLLAATRALAAELAPEVRVNAVAPGIALFPEGYDEETRKRLLGRTLLGREGGAEEVAAAVRYLVDGTHTMTGQVLVLDGGRTVVL